MPPRKRKAPAPKPIATPLPVEEEESDDEVEAESSAEEEEESQSGSEEELEDDEDEDEDASSGDESESQREALLQLVEPFTKDQIIDLLISAARKNPKLLSKLVEKANSDPAHRKIFVHGLSWDATSDQLLEIFSEFGEIEESKLVTDKVTGRAKGYAFVQFKTRSSAKKALKVPQKRIGTRMVSCQLAAAGPSSGSSADAGDGGSRKIYVGNVGPQVDAGKLKAFFSRYGEIEDLPIGLDFATNKFKGFAVFTYKSIEGFKKALEEPMKVFENCQLHCKKFVERAKNPNNLGGASNQITNAAAMSPAVIPGMANFGNMGMNPAMFGANLNAGGILMPQNFGFGFAGNPMLAAAAGYNQAGLVGPALSGGYGVNSTSPSVMGSYGSQAALQGLGAFQNPSLLGHSDGARSQGRDQSPPRTFPSSYFNR